MQSSQNSPVYEFGPFRLVPTERLLLRDERPVPLTPKAFETLVALVERRGHLIGKDELLNLVWAQDFVEEGNLARCVHTLRKALGEGRGEHQYIETVPKGGYRFVAEVRESETGPHGGQDNGAGDLFGKGRRAAEPATEPKTSQPDGDSRTRDLTSPPTSPPRWPAGATVLISLSALILATAAVALILFTRDRRVITEESPIDSIAVLPFINTSGDPEAEYLAEGISDSVINSLSRLPKLRVISLSSVLRYKGKQTDPQTVARELNVRAVLMGRLMQSGNGLTISVELVDVRDNRRLWGEQYNSNLSDVLAVQGEIAWKISERLRLRLTGEEQKQLAKRYTENTEAYQLYLLGRHYFRKQTKEGFEKSIEYYEQAIKADPNYALAYTGLARAYHWMGTRGFWPAKESKQKVEWAALKALQLDETLAEGHVRLGVLKFNNFDWAGAERELKRALELDASSPEANSAYFQFLAGLGRTDEALRYAIRAQELDPTGTTGNLGLAYLFHRQFDQAIDVYRKEIEKNPGNALMHILLGEAYVAKGMAEEGVAEMQKGVALDPSLAKTPERWDRYPMLAYAYAVAGRRGAALKILDEQQRLAKQRDDGLPYNLAIIYTGLGDKDQAFEWLEKCIEQRTPLVYRLRVRPMFDPLRSDARYPELLRRMNLEP